jgi:hypothetical protein
MKMRMKFLLFLLILLSSGPLASQPQVYQFKELQRYLPAGDFENYVRGKPSGETSSMMGFSTSWTQVVYLLSTDTSKSSISLKITDMVSIPSYMDVSGDVDKETPTGYEKTVLYKDIRVLESFDSVSRSGKLQLPVSSRFLVEITGTGMESTELLYNLLDRTDIEGLRKLAQPAGSP